MPPNRRLITFLFQPLINFSHWSLTQALVAVIVTITLLHALRIFLMSTVAPIVLNCPTETSNLSALVRLASIAAIPILVLVQCTSYSLFKKMLNTDPPSKTSFLVVSILITPIHALLSAYVLYGPTLSPHQFFCSVPTSLIPPYNAMHAPVLSALIYVPFYCLTVFQLRIFSAPPSPFPQSVFRRALSIIPQALFTVSIPAIPTSLFALAIALITRPPRSLYASIVLTVTRSTAAVCASVAAALPHALLRLADVFRGDTHSSVTSSEQKEAAAREIVSKPSTQEDIRNAVITLCRAPQSSMLPFPPFGDPSGRQWRNALEATLFPLANVCTQVRGMRHSVSSTIRAQPVAPITRLPVSDSVIQEAIAVGRILPIIFEASVQHDSFGVALPTLPYVLSMLVLAHDGLRTVLSSTDGVKYMSYFPVLSNLKLHPSLSKMIVAIDNFIEKRSQLAALRTLKDVLSVTIYRLSFVFQEEVRRFVDGREPGWDDQATEALRPFIMFQV